MKTGIIGLPQVGKTSLFRILTKVNVEDRGYSREAHLGVAKVPDDRLDRLAAQCNPKKLVHATVEYADVAAISQEALKESALLASLRNVDALIHVLRAFEDDSIPHTGELNPARDAKNLEFDLMLSDLTCASDASLVNSKLIPWWTSASVVKVLQKHAKYIILNLATDNANSGPLQTPATLRIDYIRLWQH